MVACGGDTTGSAAVADDEVAEFQQADRHGAELSVHGSEGHCGRILQTLDPRANALDLRANALDLRANALDLRANLCTDASSLHTNLPADALNLLADALDFRVQVADSRVRGARSTDEGGDDRPDPEQEREIVD